MFAAEPAWAELQRDRGIGSHEFGEIDAIAK